MLEEETPGSIVAAVHSGRPPDLRSSTLEGRRRADAAEPWLSGMSGMSGHVRSCPVACPVVSGSMSGSMSGIRDR